MSEELSKDEKRLQDQKRQHEYELEWTKAHYPGWEPDKPKPISWPEALEHEARINANLEQEIAEGVAAEARMLGDDNAERNFIWAYRLLLAFAKHLLATEPIGEGHRDHEWGDLVGTSQSMYMHQARRLAGIDDDEFLVDIRNGLYDVGDIYEEFDGSDER